MSGDWIHTVYRSATGNWANEGGSGEPVYSVHATNEDAVRRGQQLALAAQTSHVIHDIDGTISSSSMYGDDRVLHDAGKDSV